MPDAFSLLAEPLLQHVLAIGVGPGAGEDENGESHRTPSGWQGISGRGRGLGVSGGMGGSFDRLRMSGLGWGAG